MINVINVPAFRDNYLWLFHLQGSSCGFVVDPGDAAPVEAALARHQLRLSGILVTHHHPDHTGGIKTLLNNRDIPVFGPHSAKIPSVTKPLREGEQLTLKDGMHFQVLEVPGHTLDHIAYFNAAEKILFCGDTLFAAGCGRMFEGNPQQMQASLQKLAHLPVDTRVYCAHEYTSANLAFATAVEPDNQTLQQRAEETFVLRAKGIPTVPSTVQQELLTNPFLRVNEPAVIRAASRYTGRQIRAPADVFAALRGWKDDF